LVLELLVVKEKLFACGKDKIGTAVDTLENLVLEFHPSPHSPVALLRKIKRIALPAKVAHRVITHPPSNDYHCIRSTGGSREYNGGKILMPDCQRRDSFLCDGGGKGMGRRRRQRPIGYQACSLRAFFLLRLRGRASFTRFFSPGFR